MSDAVLKNKVPERIPNREETKTMIKWKPFHLGEKVYDLSHLDPSIMQFERPGSKEQAAVVFNVNVSYTQHCFTREIPQFGDYDRTLECRDGKEVRLFDADRWELSKRLPEIVRALAQRTCQHGKQNNFVTAEMIIDDETTIEYDVFFVASKALRKGFINLFVQSAYVREKKQTGKRVGFLTILHNALNGRKTKS